MNIVIRQEQTIDYRIVEELTREAFWGAMEQETCDGEHLLVHKLRSLPSFVPELDFVAEVGGEIVGHVIYSKATIVMADDREVEVLNFGPLSVLPKHKGKGVGSTLMRHSIAEAKRLGYQAIVFYGHPDFYPRFGFSRARVFGITSATGKSLDALMAMPLQDGALDGICGRYFEDAVYTIDSEEAVEFDKSFPPKASVALTTVESVSARLTPPMLVALALNQVKYVQQMQRLSGAEVLQWEGVGECDVLQLNTLLEELKQPIKRISVMQA